MALRRLRNSRHPDRQRYFPLPAAVLWLRLPPKSEDFTAYRHARDEQDQTHCQEQEEQEFRDSRRCRGNASEPKQGGYQRDHQKNNSPTQHLYHLPPKLMFRATMRACVCGNATTDYE